MAMPVVVSQLHSMFSVYPPALVEDVLRQCDGDAQRALDALLSLGHGVKTSSPNFALPVSASSKEVFNGSQFRSKANPVYANNLVNKFSKRNSRKWWPSCGVGCTNNGSWASNLWFTPRDSSRHTINDTPLLEGWPTAEADDSCTEVFQTLVSDLPGNQSVTSVVYESSELFENELLEAMPHLAGLIGMSRGSFSGKPHCSLVPYGHQQTKVFNDNFLSSDLFPNLKIEIVEDIIQRYDHATAMKHLMMLSQCVAEGCGISTKEVPSAASWLADSARSSCSDARDAFGCLTSLEQLDYLQKQFPSMGATEVQAVLEACDDHLEAAVQLLNTFAREDAAQTAPEGDAQSFLTSSHVHGATGWESAPLEGPPLQMSAGLRQLCKCFPDAPEEFVKVALQLADTNVAEAHRTLMDQGYTEVVDVEGAQSRGPLIPAQNLVAVEECPSGSNGKATASPPKCASDMSLSELTFRRNQQIYEEERMRQSRLMQAKKKCRELARAARQRGEYRLADQLYQQAKRYEEQQDLEGKQASRRISKRINASGPVSTITEDLHGKHVHEALDMVLEQIRSLPKCFSRGVQVTYITGKGLHSSNGARIKPALMELLTNYNIQFEEYPGSVVVMFAPD